MSDAFAWLDNLGASLGDVAGRAVQAAGDVAVARINARAPVPDETPVMPTSPLQVAEAAFVPHMPLIIGAVAVVALAFLVLRKG